MRILFKYQNISHFIKAQNVFSPYKIEKILYPFCFFYLKAAREEFMRNVQRSDARSSDSIVLYATKNDGTCALTFNSNYSVNFNKQK